MGWGVCGCDRESVMDWEEQSDLQHLDVGLCLGGVGRVPLLPEELARAEEGRRVLEFPPHLCERAKGGEGVSGVLGQFVGRAPV